MLLPDGIADIVREASKEDGCHNLDQLLRRWKSGVQLVDVEDETVFAGPIALA